MKRTSYIVLTVMLLAAFAATNHLNLRLVEARKAAGISRADPMINAPPMVVFTTVALGGFRGIIADILWMRSAELQQQGRFFELVQLADWITKLEPRFSEVWAYHAWNLAYNVSVLFTDHEDRWRWVRHGVTLLRDEGLVYNPGDPGLLTELGWLFQHKIGFTADSAHLTYKREWAKEMEDLLGGARPDYVNLTDDDTARIRDEYKLDPGYMQILDNRYGPLDWRMPQAHAIYWANKAREKSRGDEIYSAERMIYQSMADAFRRGTFTIKADGTFVVRPNLELLPYVLESFEQAIRVFGDIPGPRDSYVNFMTEAVLILYVNGRDTEATALLSRLKGVETLIPGDVEVEDFVVVSYARPVPGADDAMEQAVERARTSRDRAAELGDDATAHGYKRLIDAIEERM